MDTDLLFSSAFKASARTAIEECMANGNLKACLLVTPDGFDIVSIGLREEDAARLVATLSTTGAMANAIGNQIDAGSIGRLIFEYQGASVMIRHVAGTPHLLLIFIAVSAALLGNALWLHREAAARIAALRAIL